jgi:hypothetical protein
MYGFYPSLRAAGHSAHFVMAIPSAIISSYYRNYFIGGLRRSYVMGVTP